MLISVDEMRVKTTCGEIHFLVREKERCMNNIDNLVQSVSGSWQGESEKAYENKIISIRRQYAKLIEFWDSYANLMEEIVNSYEEFEMKYASRINNI